MDSYLSNEELLSHAHGEDVVPTSETQCLSNLAQGRNKEASLL